MGFIESIANFFSLFFSKSYGSSQNYALQRKLESELKSFGVTVYRNGKLLGNFAEAVRILHINTLPLNELFIDTIGSSDVERRKRYEAQLVLTGFSDDEQKIIDSLSYENRKKVLFETDISEDKEFEIQRRSLDKILTALRGDSFHGLDKAMMTLHQLIDLCRFNFLPILQSFDPHYKASPSYTPNYHDEPLVKLGNAVEDLYSHIEGLALDQGIARAVVALATLKNRGELSDERRLSYIQNVSKIASVISHVLVPAHLKKIVCIYHADANYEAALPSYKEFATVHFAQYFQRQYKADTDRLKAELKDMKIRGELRKMFFDDTLEQLAGYNESTSKNIHAHTPFSFSYITPLAILKKFLQWYLLDDIQTLFKDIVIEGFFNNPSYKTDFSELVYAICDLPERLEKFENLFSTGNDYDVAMLEGLTHDLHKDSHFYTKLEGLVEKINSEAQQFLQEAVNSLYELHTQITDLLSDAKKTTGKIISNLRVLVSSSRKRESFALLEQQLPSWDVFFEVMKNYTVIVNRQ